LHERIAAPGLPTELSGLAETFNSMLDRLEESFLHISQFSDDVAHELRPPSDRLGNYAAKRSCAAVQGAFTEDSRQLHDLAAALGRFE